MKDGAVVAKRRGGAAATIVKPEKTEGAKEEEVKRRKKVEKKKEADPSRKGKTKVRKIPKRDVEAAMEFQQLAGVSPGSKLRQSPRLKERALQGEGDLLDISTSIRSAHRTLECE